MEITVMVIGLGSMGKRRIRNMQAIGIKNIYGFDVREDRRIETQEKYGIEVSDDFDKLIDQVQFDAFIISLPPDIHHIYMKKALELKIPAFIEASVVDTDLAEIIALSKEKNVLLAPSCTLWYHPAIKKISKIINENELGKISNFLYHSGQYLPDWHTYENVDEYYVSNRSTGGAREIVPFELTWITKLLGFPNRAMGFHKKTIEIQGAPEIDDTYNLLLDYNGFIFNLSVDVVSRCATRRMVINGDKKQLYWDWDNNVIRVFDAASNTWEHIDYETISAEDGYNKNITEQMYIEELTAFFNAAVNNESYPNNLEDDHKVLKLLYNVEKFSDSYQTQE